MSDIPIIPGERIKGYKEEERREKDVRREKEEEYEEIATVGLSFGVIIGIGILGIIVLSLTGSGSQSWNQSWKSLTEQEIQNIKLVLN